MSIGAILVGIAMLLVAVLLVLNPFLNSMRQKPALIADEEIISTADRHTELLQALRDLDFDHRTGKITQEDYTLLRQSLLVHAANTLEAKEKEDVEFDARLERAIQERREKRTSTRVCSSCGTNLEPSDRFCRRCGKPIEAACIQCGTKLEANDQFCNMCGAPQPAGKANSPVEEIK